MKLQLDEARRLTGPNLLWEHAGAIVDVLINGVDKQSVAECWQKWAVLLLAEFGWSRQRSTWRLHADGANLAISAPRDALYTACDLAELAWDCCAAEMQTEPQPDWQARLAELRIDREREANPQLLEIEAAAQSNNVICLTDDDHLSLGMGVNAEVWSIDELPDPASLAWKGFTRIPTALITGTNGKSTCVRLASEIARSAGLVAGVTSTDFIRVGDEIIDRGDYSGPGGARMLLRDNRTEIAFLEVARGGILRRGLPVQKVDAALVTNVASDHLGQYGINTIEDLAETKFVVARALDADGVLVVNADNDLVVAQAAKTGKTLCWFSTEEDNPLIQQQLQTGGRCVFVRSAAIVYHSESVFESLGRISEIPMTFNGTAKHNIKNALGVAGLCRALKLPLEAIREGLRGFGSNAEDNPGRGNVYQANGCRVIVDFAHNAHSMRAVVDMVKQMPANGRIAVFSHGGDRSDKDIQQLTNAIADLDARCYVVAELEAYLRGREPGEIPELVEQVLVDRGVATQQIKVAADPLQGARQALKMAEPGDV
ncbi:MAG: Mur ligase, partial [Gammaproteobacteria bacterium]|nr:Mur ligase [Gammaproteobacteria bacterium]